jgi:hypothetical protein
MIDVETIARAICREKCAFYGEPPCHTLADLGQAWDAAPWTPPPEAERDEGYRCLGYVDGAPFADRWSIVQWRNYGRAQGVWICEGRSEIASVTAFAPLPPAQKGEATP